MNQSPDQNQSRNHLQNLARWVLLVPVVLLILFACGQFALVSARTPAVEGPLTKMQANYKAWDFTVIQPLDTDRIMADILKDRSRNISGAPSSINLVSSVVWPTQRAGQQDTPIPPAPTAQTSPTLPATSIPQLTATVAVSPSATQVIWIPYTATNIPPPADTKTPTNTPTATATATNIATSTPTTSPTVTKTFTPTPLPSMNIGTPDGNVMNLGSGNELIIDLQAETGSPLDTSSPDGDYDIVMYEFEPSAGIIMFDHIVLQVGTGPTGSCSSSAWTTILHWGDADASNNGMIGNLYPGEPDNQTIPFANLYNGSTTGIAIDVDANAAPWLYPCLRIYSPISGDGDAAQVDSIELLP